MLQIRTRSGGVQQVPEGVFVEICDLLGKVGVAFTLGPDGEIIAIPAGTPEAERYAKLFGVEFSKFRKLPKEFS